MGWVSGGKVQAKVRESKDGERESAGGVMFERLKKSREWEKGKMYKKAKKSKRDGKRRGWK